MVKHVVDGLESGGDVAEILHPAHVGIHRATHLDGDTKAMTVQATAFVSFGNVGQKMGGFECKGFADNHGANLEICWPRPYAILPVHGEAALLVTAEQTVGIGQNRVETSEGFGMGVSIVVMAPHRNPGVGGL